MVERYLIPMDAKQTPHRADKTGDWVRFTDHEATIATLRAELEEAKREIARLNDALAFSDNNAEKLEALLDPHVSWEGQPPAAQTAAEASLAEVATALPFLDRLARALKNKNGGKYSDAWTDDGHTLSGMVSAFRTALARLDTARRSESSHG